MCSGSTKSILSSVNAPPLRGIAGFSEVLPHALRLELEYKIDCHPAHNTNAEETLQATSYHLWVRLLYTPLSLAGGDPYWNIVN